MQKKSKQEQLAVELRDYTQSQRSCLHGCQVLEPFSEQQPDMPAFLPFWMKLLYLFYADISLKHPSSLLFTVYKEITMIKLKK